MTEIVPVSVIIPCFRCANTINRAVASVVQQTQQPAELILVEDSSGDDTLIALHALAKQYPNWITIIALQENQGAANARNAGWAVATQPYIAFLDADDSWYANKIELQYNYMINNPEVAISGHRCVCLRSEEATTQMATVLKVTKINAWQLLFKNCFSTPSVMLKQNLPFRFVSTKRYAEDFYLWQQLAFAGLLITRIEMPLAHIHKALYGESGLSAQLWEMEKGELNNFVLLYQNKAIHVAYFVSAYLFSLVKFIKRFFMLYGAKVFK